jgi:hypothetical protein
MSSSIPNYEIHLLYDGSTITTRLYHIMSQQLHKTAIKEYIKKKSGWTNRDFSQVNWDAHDMAFKQLTRGNQIMVAKLIYNIVNTNKQNHQFYGKSSFCRKSSYQHSTGSSKCSNSWYAPVDCCPTRRANKCQFFDSRIP